MNKDDAIVCAKNGVDGIWISNQGGRTLDTQPSTIAVLKSIVKALH